MIKYDLTNINKWYNGSRNIVKCYHGSTLAFDLTGGAAPMSTVKFNATYSDGTSYSAVCDGSTTLTTGTTRAHTTDYSRMTSAVVGECIETIWERAFSGCSNLSSVTISNSVTEIGEEAFRSCTKLKNIDIPNSVRIIGEYAFTSCSSLQSVTIPSGITSIATGTFDGCTNLTSVTLSNSVTSIGQQAFRGCSFTSIDIPNSVTGIGILAFANCGLLSSVTIPSSVTGIGNYAFDGCSGLTSITVNATTPPTLGTSVFYQTNDCPIYVPCDSVEAYKTAWSTYASRITCVQPTPPTPTGQTPCYAVTDNIAQYQSTDFVDVYDTTADKWYKLNNLNEYEEYGIYGSGRTNTTTYEGKLTIDDGYEYIYSGNTWVNLGEVSGGTTQTVWYDPPSSGSDNANFNIGHYWGENYKMIYTMYLQGSYSGDKGSFWQGNQKTPLEFHFYNNGYYFDLHNPTSTSSPSVNTTDYDDRLMRQNVFRNYESGQVMNVTLTYGSVKVELEESGTVIESTGSTRTGYSWYNGLYEPSIILENTAQTCHVSRIQVYNASDVLVNDLKFVKNNGVTGSQEISMVDTVLNVVYNNTNDNTPCYHVVEEGGGSTYPEYYDEIADPPTSVTFATMADALAYQCPYVGLRAIIAGDKYIFNSNYEWEEVTSRLPVGYTEVEYSPITDQ